MTGHVMFDFENVLFANIKSIFKETNAIFGIFFL